MVHLTNNARMAGHEHQDTSMHEGGIQDGDEDTDAALAALRAAISAGNGPDATGGVDMHDGIDPALGDVSLDDLDDLVDVPIAGEGLSGSTANGSDSAAVDAAPLDAQQRTEALSLLTHLHKTNTALVGSMNLAVVLQGLLDNVKTLTENQKKQSEILQGLLLGHSASGAPSVDETGMAAAKGDTSSTSSALTAGWIPKSQYDALHAKYSELLSTTAAGKKSGEGRKRRQKPVIAGGPATVAQSQSPAPAPGPGSAGATVGESPAHWTAGPTADAVVGSDGLPKRKKRSVRLEHIIHQHLNRLIGVEYTIASFEVPGSAVLLPPCPDDEAPGPDESVNWVQEVRPDFTKSNEDPEIRVLLDRVVREVWARWEGGEKEGEEGVDVVKVTENVNTYWNRLMKRWSEQQAREKGVPHPDEIARRKQNQYRRQQSLVGRRVAAFDRSPLNASRQRALFRTLMTIDFAPATNERPDIDEIPASSPGQKRDRYHAVEWFAYRADQLQGEADKGHEVVDQFWLSAAARYALAVLDGSSTFFTEQSKRKGRPRAPAPVFHLPRLAWAKGRDYLPVLRPKDADGLPVEGAQGLVLFDWHVDDDVRRMYPDWAEGLYETPPLPGADGQADANTNENEDELDPALKGDSLLPDLDAIMFDPQFAPVKQFAEAEMAKMDVREMTWSEIERTITEADIVVPQLAGARPPDRPAGADGDAVASALGTVWRPGAGLSDGVSESLASDALSAEAGGNAYTSANAQAAAPDALASATSTEVQSESADYYNLSHAQAVAAALVDQQKAQARALRQQQQERDRERQARPSIHMTRSDPTAISAPLGSAAAATTIAAHQSLSSSSGSTSTREPSGPGTSAQARKVSKRSMSAVPVGAATPVAKRLRSGLTLTPSPSLESGLGTASVPRPASAAAAAAAAGLYGVGVDAGSPLGTLAAYGAPGTGGSVGGARSGGERTPDLASIPRHFDSTQYVSASQAQQQPIPHYQQQQQQQQQQVRHPGIGVGIGVGVGVGVGMGRSVSGPHVLHQQ